MTKIPETPETALLANPLLTRRTMFSMAAVVGGLHFVGSMFCGNSLITAYADDAGNPHFVVVILSNEEIGAFVFDVTNDCKPIKDAYVKVTSRSNGKYVDGKTSEEGILVMNVKTLAQNGDEENPVCYVFTAKAEVVAAGYREFAFDHQQLYSGPKEDQRAHVFFPAQPYNAQTDGPYLRMACMDGHDALYNTCNMPKYQGNVGVHTAKFQVVCKKGSTATCSLYTEGEKLIAGPVSAQSTDAGYATIELSGTWAKDVQVATKFYVVFEADGKKRSCPLTYLLREPDFNISAPYIDNDFYVGVGAGGGGRKISEGKYDPDLQNALTAENAKVPYGPTKITIPKTPWGEDLELLSSLPFSRVSFTTTPAGGIGIVIRSETWAPFADPEDPRPDPQGNFVQRWWKGFKEDWSDWGGKFKESGKKVLKDYENLLDTADPMTGLNGKGFHKCDVTANFEFKILAYVFGLPEEEIKQREEDIKKGLTPKPRDYRWEGTLRGGMNFLIAGEVGAQIAFGVIPVVVGLDFKLEIAAALEAGLSCKPAFKDVQWFLISESTRGQGGFTIDITGEGGLSAGVGIRGLFSVSVRGFASFPVQFAFLKSERGRCPHTTAKMNLGVQLVLQVVFIKIRQNICKPMRKVLYDSWKKKNEPIAALTEAEYDAGFYQDPALGDALTQDNQQEMSYLSDDLMEQECELSALVNNEGVLCEFNVMNLALPDEAQMQEQGIVDPFSANASEAYDPRRGVIPKIQTPFVNPADGTVANTYADPRMSIVQVGNYLYYCRIARVSVKGANDALSLAVVPLAGRQGGDSSIEATGYDSYFVFNKTCAGRPRVSYAPAGTGDEEKLIMPTYGKVLMYADENGPSDVAVAEPDIPLYSVCNESDAPANAVESDSAVTDKMRAIAISMGWDGYERSDAESDVVCEAIEMAESEQELRGYVSASANATTLTRVVVSAFNLTTRKWESNDVVDFTLPSSVAATMRSNANDVDFTVVADGDELLFGLITCTKPWTRRPDLQQLKEGLYTSLVRYSPAKNNAHGKVISAHSNIFSKIRSDRYEWKAVPYSITRKGTSGSSQQKYFGLTVTGPRGVYAGKPQNALVSYFYSPAARTGANIYADKDPNAFVYYPSQKDAINDDGVLQVFAQHRSGNSDYLQVSWEYNESYVTEKSGPVQPAKQRAVLWTFDTDGEGSKKNQFDITAVENYTVLGKDKGIAWLQRSVKKDTEIKLMNVRIGADGLPMAASDLGYIDSNAFFTSGNADYLYCVRVKEGSVAAPEADEAEAILESIDAGGAFYNDYTGFSAEGTDIATLAKGGSTTVKQYQMTACRWDPKFKRYREFFPYAQLQSAPDTISAYPLPVVTGKLGGTSVLYSTITNLRKSNAMTTYAEIPPVACADIVGAQCLDNFIAVGATVHPAVRLTNMGNLPVSGFSLEFVEKDTGSVLATYVIDHLEKNVMNPMRPLREKDVRQALDISEEEYDQLEADSFQSNSLITIPAGSYAQEDESILWPGNSRLYKTELKTPASWKSGSHTVIVRKKDLTIPSFDVNDDECLLFDNESSYVTIDKADEFEIELDFDGEFESGAEGFEPVYYTDVETGKTDGGATPKTGDGSMGAVAAAAAAAALAVGVGAAAASKVRKSEDAD